MRRNILYLFLNVVLDKRFKNTKYFLEKKRLCNAIFSESRDNDFEIAINKKYHSAVQHLCGQDTFSFRLGHSDRKGFGLYLNSSICKNVLR